MVYEQTYPSDSGDAAWRSLATICSIENPNIEIGMAQPCHLVATKTFVE
jgi:hypothetical protein